MHWFFSSIGAPVLTPSELKIDATSGKKTEIKINVQSKLSVRDIKLYKVCDKKKPIDLKGAPANDGKSIDIVHTFAEKEDTGNYFCSARTIFRRANSTNINVEVKKSCK